MARKHVAPSRLRYEASHPCISFRLSREEFKKLEEIRRRSRLSLAEIARRCLGVHLAQTREAYNHGRRTGLKEGLGQVELPCPRCKGPMRIDLKSAANEQAADLVRKALSGWRHVTCPDNRR